MKRTVTMLLLGLALWTMASCSHTAELRQEVAACNDLLPAPICSGLTAQSIELTHDALVYNILYDELYFNDVDISQPTHRQALNILIETGVGDEDLHSRLAKAGYHVEYNLIMSITGDTLRLLPDDVQ
ncbi:MAG: hypothetical protein K5864_00260 [Bacteroidales bacterium]|nr:hypothetical protein [Bacteroidales bacterium]